MPQTWQSRSAALCVWKAVSLNITTSHAISKLPIALGLNVGKFAGYTAVPLQ